MYGDRRRRPCRGGTGLTFVMARPVFPPTGHDPPAYRACGRPATLYP
ncbi:hypothetical protein [Alloactinosynnema sp. L-07]|nr:hypothetical protein [Alloactinosynnema sp. L-07]